MNQYKNIKKTKPVKQKIEHFRVFGGISQRDMCMKKNQQYVGIVDFSIKCKCGNKLPDIRL